MLRRLLLVILLLAGNVSGKESMKRGRIDLFLPPPIAPNFSAIEFEGPRNPYLPKRVAWKIPAREVTVAATLGLTVARIYLNHLMITRRHEMKDHITNDNGYLAGTLAANLLPPIAVIGTTKGEKNRYLGKELFILATLAAFAQGGITDAAIYDKKIARVWANNPQYYAGVIIQGLAPAATMLYWSPRKCQGLWTITGAGILGGVLWDCVFSYLRYKDPLYPVPNWFGGWGFEKKSQRILFDAGRIGAGLFCLWMAEKEESTKEKKYEVLFTPEIRPLEGYAGLTLRVSKK